MKALLGLLTFAFACVATPSFAGLLPNDSCHVVLVVADSSPARFNSPDCKCSFTIAKLTGQPSGLSSACSPGTGGCTSCNCYWIEITNTGNCDVNQILITNPSPNCAGVCAWIKQPSPAQWSGTPNYALYGCLTGNMNFVPGLGVPLLIPVPGLTSKMWIQICTTTSTTFTIKLQYVNDGYCSQDITIP